MAGIYAEKKGMDTILVEPGTYVARAVQMVEIGTIRQDFNGEERKAQKVSVTWELPTELAVFNEEKGEQPFVVSKEYTLSMHEKSNLRKDLESWRGQGYSEEEAKHVDITNLLGQACMLTIIHVPGKKDPSRTYAQIATVTKMMKGQICPPQINPTKLLCYEDFDWELFASLPDFLKDKIKSSDEFKRLQEPNAIHDEVSNDEQEDKPPF